MPQEAETILGLAAKTINKNYSGVTLGLTSFINSIELIEKLTKADNIDIIKFFILSKLECKALEAIPASI
jgi:hypothetical protein